MRKSAFFALTFVVVGSFLTSCGSDSASGPFYTAASGTMTQAQATAIAGTLLTSATVSFAKPGDLPGTFSLQRDTDPWASCTTTTPTTPVDADGDLVPATKTVTFACNNVANQQGTTSANGSYTVTDKDDTKANAGYRYDYNMSGGWTGANGSSETFVYNGFFDFTMSPTTFVYTSNWQSTSSNTEVARVAGTYKSTYGHTFNHTITPDDMASPHFAGTASMSGFAGYLVEVTGGATGTAQNWVLKISSTGLKYDHNCNTYFKEGYFEFEDASANKLRYTYTACGTLVKTFNGTTI